MNNCLDNYIAELANSYNKVVDYENVLYRSKNINEFHIGLGGRALVEKDYMEERQRFFLLLTGINYNDLESGLQDDRFDTCRDKLLRFYAMHNGGFKYNV